MLAGLPPPQMSPLSSAIGGHMTHVTVCIGPDASLEQAAVLMGDQGVPYLAVCERGRPVGVIAGRDITLAANLADRALGAIKVAEAMSGVPYCVTPETPITEVAKHLALRKLDVALVLSGTALMGIFTLVDALRLLASMVDDGLTSANP